jgi:Asp-tRNA(Asn)/Glu-tRNA(Gln) amidotransferase A subunit family amidase
MIPFPSAAEDHEAVRSGTKTTLSVLGRHLDRAVAANAEIDAFACIDADVSRAMARDVDPSAPLSGVMLAVKDNLDTADFPSAYGSPLYANHRPAADAAAVALAREAGATLIGKTVTTEFAASRVGRTGNPHRFDHTPGGSSSGSAAAVAAGMAHVAFGTQTVGSVIRPAAFCGVVGFKPSFGVIPRIGLKVVADSVDTIGIFARSVPDVSMLFKAVSDLATPPSPPVKGLKIGVCHTPFWDRADAATQAHLKTIADRLAALGATLVDLPMPQEWVQIHDWHKTICEFEGARNMAHEMRTGRDFIGPDVIVQWDNGRKISPDTYADAANKGRRLRQEWDTLAQSVDLTLTPSAPGEAPAGRGNTGDPIFNGLWTFLRLPCITLPTGTGPTGLPIGSQFIGKRRHDGELLAAATAIEAALASG